MYCIYTDKDVASAAGNYDHIIPLSLGGLNQFTVWSDLDFNAKMGSKVDGAMANDFILSFHRYAKDVRGHGASPAPPTVKRAKVRGEPFQVSFTKQGMRFWDAKKKQYVNLVGQDSYDVELALQINKFSPARFAAKVALGGGYFTYGDVLRRSVDCDILRRLVELDPVAARSDQRLLSSGVHICDRFHEDSRLGHGALYKALCEFTGRSTLIMTPHVDGITFNVGLMGHYVASIIMPGDGRDLPIGTDQHDVGHAILLGPNAPIERLSLRSLCARFYREVQKRGPPDIPL